MSLFSKCRHDPKPYYHEHAGRALLEYFKCARCGVIGAPVERVPPPPEPKRPIDPSFVR